MIFFKAVSKKVYKKWVVFASSLEQVSKLAAESKLNKNKTSYTNKPGELVKVFSTFYNFR